MPLCM